MLNTWLFILLLCVAWGCFVLLLWWSARERRIRARRRQRPIEVIDLTARRAHLGRGRR